MGAICRADAIKVAHDVLDRKTKSYVGSAIELSQFLLAEEAEREAGQADGYRQLADALTECQARSTELIGQVRELKRAIEKIAKVADGRVEPELKKLLDETLMAVRAMQ